MPGLGKSGTCRINCLKNSPSEGASFTWCIVTTLLQCGMSSGPESDAPRIRPPRPRAPPVVPAAACGATWRAARGSPWPAPLPCRRSCCVPSRSPPRRAPRAPRTSEIPRPALARAPGTGGHAKSFWAQQPFALEMESLRKRNIRRLLANRYQITLLLTTASRPRQIRSLAGVHADFLAFIDEGRDLHHQSGLQLCRLHHVARGGRFQPRLGLDHGQLHRLRQFDPDRLAVVKLHFDLQIRDEVVHGLAEHVPGKVRL